MINRECIKKIVSLAIQEDVGSGDITANLLPEMQLASAYLFTREEAIICGHSFVEEVFYQLDSSIELTWLVAEGQLVSPNQRLCEIKGPVKSLLTGERIALNFLQTLSGTATLTNKYVEKLKGTRTQLLDTRKTIPGLRQAQKYAVTCGGGQNHRLGLFDAFLIKENHIAACGSIKNAIQSAKTHFPGKSVEVEVETLAELEEAISERADIVMLDNFDLVTMHQAVTINAGRCKLEVSGNITLDNIAEIAQLGVDFISVGAITKHVYAIDLSMRISHY